MRALESVYLHNPTKEVKDDFILCDLLEDGLIYLDAQKLVRITYYGFRTLQQWDPVLEVTVDDHLMSPAHGDA